MGGEIPCWQRPGSDGGAEPWGGRLPASLRVQRALRCDIWWTFTPIYHQPESCASLGAQGNGRGIFLPSLVSFPEGEILMQMSNTQRLLSSDLEVVVSGLPGGLVQVRENGTSLTTACWYFAQFAPSPAL